MPYTYVHLTMLFFKIWPFLLQLDHIIIHTPTHTTDKNQSCCLPPGRNSKWSPDVLTMSVFCYTVKLQQLHTSPHTHTHAESNRLMDGELAEADLLRVNGAELQLCLLCDCIVASTTDCV